MFHEKNPRLFMALPISMLSQLFYSTQIECFLHFSIPFFVHTKCALQLVYELIKSLLSTPAARSELLFSSQHYLALLQKKLLKTLQLKSFYLENIKNGKCIQTNVRGKRQRKQKPLLEKPVKTFTTFCVIKSLSSCFVEAFE
jgi:hypothetical protein